MKIFTFFLLFQTSFSLFAGECPSILKKLIKESEMIEQVFPNEHIHKEILSAATFIKGAKLANIKVLDQSNIFPDNVWWKYQFQFIKDGPILTISVNEKELYITFLVTKNKKQHFHLGDYLKFKHGEDTSLAIRNEYKFSKNISSMEMFTQNIELLKSQLEGEVGEILRGEKWIEVPDYTMSRYK